MTIEITIAGTDRTANIKRRKFRIDEAMNEISTLDFQYEKFGSRTWTPARGDEVIVTDTDTATKLFAGKIVEIEMSLNRTADVINYAVACKDYQVDFDDELVVQTYEAQTIQQIIDDIKPSGFTSANVSGATSVDKISFNYRKKSEVIDDLAKLLNYSWYVDYDKDIHFFAKNETPAPFDVTDSATEVIGGSLSLEVNNAQLRNSVYVLGGEYVGSSRAENYDADGEQDKFPLANKFSEKPTVTLNGGAVTVGVDPLQNFLDGYDAVWNYQQKFLWFDATPSAGDNIAITGTPLIPVAVQSEDAGSIATYGRKEFKIEDVKITDLVTARKRGSAELEAYKDGITEGVFMTYESTLTPGQTIRINSTALGVNELYLIKKIRAEWHTTDSFVYAVEVVSHRTLGLIELLQKLILDGDDRIRKDEDRTIVLAKTNIEAIEVTEEIALDVEKVVHEAVDVAEQVRADPWTIRWVWGPYFPASDADPKRRIRWGRFRWE